MKLQKLLKLQLVQKLQLNYKNKYLTLNGLNVVQGFFMKKNNYILYFIFICFFACKAEPELPKGILTEDKMIDLLVDMEVVQATLKYDAASERIKPNYTLAFEEVYQKHHLNKELFDTNLNFYCAEPLKMRKVYDKVLVKLSEQQAELSNMYIAK